MTSARIAPADGEAEPTVTPSPFEGQPSIVTVVAVAALHVVRAITDIVHVDIGTQLAPLIATPTPPPLLTAGLDVQRSQFDGMPVWTLHSGQPSGEYVVAIHGGAYVVQPTILHWLDYATTARTTGATVIVPIYPLATQGGNASSVVPDMADLLSSVIDQHGAQHVSVYADSAGGGIALSAAQLLVKRGAAVPASMVLLSPWLDVTMSNPAIRSVDDPILSEASLKKAGLEWADGLDPTDPLVSPLYGSLDGLPPTYVYSGNLDLLSPDVLLLRQRAAAARAPFTFILRNGEFHDWALGPLTPEAVAVRPQIYDELVGTDTDGDRAGRAD